MCGSRYICNIHEFIHIHGQFDTIDEEACKKCLFGTVGSVDVHVIVGVSYTTILISEVPRIHKHSKHALLAAPLNHQYNYIYVTDDLKLWSKCQTIINYNYNYTIYTVLHEMLNIISDI